MSQRIDEKNHYVTLQAAIKDDPFLARPRIEVTYGAPAFPRYEYPEFAPGRRATFAQS